jgi:cobalt-zinc-cadmium resistance protein CzcA
MISRFVAFVLRAPILVLATAAALVVLGLYCYQRLDIEAYPNPVPPLVEVITQPQGWSAEEVERFVTIPLEIGLAGMAGLDHVRSQSLFGLSDVKCYFNWGTDYKEARQEVINRLQFVTLPAGLQAGLSPSNAIGEIFRYRVVGEGYSLRDLKTAEDWILERQFKQVPGVIDVVSYGGETKQYHVEVDPIRLRGRSLSLQQMIGAITNANQSVGGQRLSLGEQSYDVRGVGLIKTVKDIQNIVIAAQKGTPVKVIDVATATIGYAPRLGMVGYDGEADVVQGIVLMRYGGETGPTLKGVHERIAHIRKYHLLPPGMDIQPYYDRGRLVTLTTGTVLENLLIGMFLVSLVLIVFLGNTRAALITALNIPLALLIAFSGMVGSGTPANLISLGAVDFGIVVDSTVIMMENIFRHASMHGSRSIRERILASASEVGGPMSFSTLIIAVAFLPLFTLTGVSGVIFSPMAHTYAFAIGGAIALALTLTPVLASKLLRPNMKEKESVLMNALQRIYSPAFDAVVDRPWLATFIGAGPVVACVLLFPLLGREFMPKLEEGNFWIRATLPMSISLEQSAKYVGRMRAILREHDEVESVVSQLGRPDDGTDASGFSNIELFAPLKPFEEWRSGRTKETLTEDLSRELRSTFPGVVFNFSQMISDNVEEALSGVKGENSVKVMGPDLKVNANKADEIMEAMAHVVGVRDLGMFRSLGQPAIKIAPDRVLCARYGLNTGDVEAVVQAAIGGQAITQVFEGEKSFDLTIRWAPEFREDVDAIKHIGVSTPDGSLVQLGQIASVVKEDSAFEIYREDGWRYTPVKFSVRGRDLASTIAEAEHEIAGSVRLPYDTHIEWAGEINELKDAETRLMIIIPLTLLVIGLLTYGAVKTVVDTAIVLCSIPVACSGGILALLASGVHFSVSAAMGFVSIFGIAIQDAILVVTYFQRQRELGHDVRRAAREAAEKRFRPVLMTTLVATLGLTPAALSNGIGAQTQKPLAIVVIGGSLALAVLTRLVQPPLLVFVHEWFAALSASSRSRDLRG